jgi:hypothetical protein
METQCAWAASFNSLWILRAILARIRRDLPRQRLI